MNWNEDHKISIALLDLNEGRENQGMRCLREIVKQWAEINNYNVDVKEFDVRVKNEVPGTGFDIYISSGGPGSPLESIGSEWEARYFNWLTEIENWNKSDNFPKKHVFFICHSFQLVCRHYNIGEVGKRKSTSFGVFPIHLMHDGSEEVVFEGLHNPFYAVDSRDFQVIAPKHSRITEMGGRILALEKERPHVPFERAIMAVRFNDYFIGTQFHPEADARGMSMLLQREDRKKTVIENFGQEKWKSMLEHLEDPDKILYTYSHILPNFLNEAVNDLVEA
ncbi:MAG: synthase [Segetibacter sp.]|nr:synthase [Segetibacter sp.]